MGSAIVVPSIVGKGNDGENYSYRSLYGWDKIVTPSGEYFAYEDIRRMWDSLNVTHCSPDKNPSAMLCNH